MPFSNCHLILCFSLPTPQSTEIGFEYQLAIYGGHKDADIHKHYTSYTEVPGQILPTFMKKDGFKSGKY